MRRRALFALPFAVALAACGTDDAVTPAAPPAGAGWSSRAPMNEARQEVGVAELGGRLYVVGGFRADGSHTATVEVYDPATNLWSFAAPMPIALDHCAAVAAGGRIYVFGGASDPGPSARTLES